jgi:peptidoglycan hydrolase CwlO-like protein
MPEELNTVTLGENEVRLERIKLPNGNTYILGCSFEEAQEIYNVLSENIEAVNTDVEELKETELVVAASLNDLNSKIMALTQENTSLKNEIAELKELIKKQYMAYYDVDATKGIGENNTYSTTQS